MTRGAGRAKAPTPKPLFFATALQFREWLARHHETAAELWVLFYKVHTGRPSLTWPQAVDEALCVGWIDGIRKSRDDESYIQRFTPRRRGSRWSAVNVRRVGELTAEGRMLPAGLAAFEARREEDAAGYSYESRAAELSPELRKVFQKAKRAWAWFEAQPPGWRRAVKSWVMSAKGEQTRRRRLARLMEAAAARRRML